MKNKILILLFSINIAFSQGINIEGIEEFLERTETYPKEKEGLVATQIPSKYDLVPLFLQLATKKTQVRVWAGAQPITPFQQYIIKFMALQMLQEKQLQHSTLGSCIIK